MVHKETCPVCKGNKVITIEPKPGHREWRSCNGCNGAGYQVRVTLGSGSPGRY